jgi:dihydroxyacid dehydratase/phosphogluconate dehydratase
MSSRRSWVRYQGTDRAFARSWFYGTGRTEEEVKRPLVALACAWNEIAAENVHLERVARRAKDGIIAAGATPMEFWVIAIVAIHGGSINPGDVVVIRNEGPRGGPGFREMLGATAAIVGMGLAETVVLPKHATAQ